MVALDAIGSTEVGHIYICNRLDRQHPGSVGWPVPGFEVELRDLDDAPVPDGEPGRLFVAGESITLGYWRRTERNRTAFHGRYFDTGDTFVRNDDGSYTYLGRGDDMIKAGGIWVSPTEVEAAIIELPEVALAAVVGVPDADGLEKPKAFVVLEAGVEGSDELVARIQQHVKRTLAPFKYPRWVEFRDELPLTATGKLRRHVLRDEARARGLFGPGPRASRPRNLTELRRGGGPVALGTTVRRPRSSPASTRSSTPRSTCSTTAVSRPDHSTTSPPRSGSARRASTTTCRRRRTCCT
jgi:acyl-coenzyme A synthetase/AMP-(fatty) acid ligase